MINKVTLIGRLGQDTETKTFEGGGSIAKNSLATSDDYKNKQGEWVDVTDWHNIQVSGDFLVKKLENLPKGTLVYAEGKCKTRKWQDKEGNNRYMSYIQVSKLRSLTPKGDDGSFGGSTAETGGEAIQAPLADGSEAAAQGADDDLPF